MMQALRIHWREYLIEAVGLGAFMIVVGVVTLLEPILFISNPLWKRVLIGISMGLTAIAISNTATSLRFYGDLLGLKLAGESENYGTEQEHLNNVSGARLHISGLRALNGPGIEFLEYLNPRDGRAFPMNARADDLFHWQTTLIVDDAETIARRLQANGYIFVSSGVIEIPQQTLGFKKGF